MLANNAQMNKKPTISQEFDASFDDNLFGMQGAVFGGLSEAAFLFVSMTSVDVEKFHPEPSDMTERIG